MREAWFRVSGNFEILVHCSDLLRQSLNVSMAFIAVFYLPEIDTLRYHQPYVATVDKT